MTIQPRNYITLITEMFYSALTFCRQTDGINSTFDVFLSHYGCSSSHNSIAPNASDSSANIEEFYLCHSSLPFRRLSEFKLLPASLENKNIGPRLF